jgi:hypothetical protein
MMMTSMNPSFGQLPATPSQRNTVHAPARLMTPKEQAALGISPTQPMDNPFASSGGVPSVASPPSVPPPVPPAGMESKHSPIAQYQAVSTQPEKKITYDSKQTSTHFDTDKAKGKKGKKKFNPLKWAGITAAVGVTTLAGGTLAFRHWFMKNPGTLTKHLNAAQLEEFLSQVQQGKAPTLPVGYKIPDRKMKTPIGQVMGYVDSLRYLPKENKKKLFNHLISFRSAKTLMGTAWFGVRSFLTHKKWPLGYSQEGFNKALSNLDTDYLADFMEAGGSLTKKAGQSLAGALRLEAGLNLDKKADVQAEPSVAFMQKLYRSMASLQSRKITLSKEQVAYYGPLADRVLADLKADPRFADQAFPKITEMEATEASTGVYFKISDDLGFKLQRPDSTGEAAVQTTEFFTNIFNHTAEVVLKNKKLLEQMGARGISGVVDGVAKDKLQERSFEGAAAMVGSMLQGTNMESEQRGAEALADIAKRMGMPEFVQPPQVYLAKNYDIDGKTFGGVVIQHINGKNTSELYRAIEQGDEEALKQIT